MDEPEFQNYLALLTGLLRLSGKQREKIAAEMQDHLEQRTEELLTEGLSREEAVSKALADFGDATGLASELTRVAELRRRRLIMRLSSIVVVAAVTATLVAAACLAYAKDSQTPLPAKVPALAAYTIKGNVSRVDGQSKQHRLAAPRITAWEGQVASITMEDDKIRVTMATVVRPGGTAETEFRLVKVLPLASPKITHKLGQTAVISVEADGKEYRFEVTATRVEPDDVKADHKDRQSGK